MENDPYLSESNCDHNIQVLNKFSMLLMRHNGAWDIHTWSLFPCCIAQLFRYFPTEMWNVSVQFSDDRKGPDCLQRKALRQFWGRAAMQKACAAPVCPASRGQQRDKAALPCFLPSFGFPNTGEGLPLAIEIWMLLPGSKLCKVARKPVIWTRKEKKKDTSFLLSDKMRNNI